MSKILFFDGVCVMCNGLVDLVLQNDKKKNILFAPLQGSTAAEKVPTFTELYSVVFLKDGDIYTKSDAILMLFYHLGGVYKFLALLFRIFPRVVRDWVYKIIARNRYRIFGKNQQCRIPSFEEQQRFLP